MKPIAIRSFAVAAALVASAAALAADDPWGTFEDALKTRGAASAVLVLVAKPDAAEVGEIGKLVAEKRLLKGGQGGVAAVRVEPGDAEWAKKVGVAAKGNERVLVLDGYGGLVDRQEKVPSAETLSRLVKQAAEVTAKKRKVEKKLDGVLAKGEAALKKEDTKTACEQFLAVLEYQAQLPCGAVEKAQRHVDELIEKGKALLEEARTAIGKGDFNRAQKLIGDAQNRFPTPGVNEEAKKVREELARAVNRQRG